MTGASNVSRIPAGGRKPARKRAAAKKAPPAVAARQAEAESEDGYASVEQCGVTLRIPLAGKIPLTVIDLYRIGDTYGGTKAMIGEEQWKLLVAAGATDGDLNELAVKLNSLSGNL